MANSSRHGYSDVITFFAFTIGVAAGAVGTVIFAALDDGKFRHVVRKVRQQTRQAERMTQDLADKTSDAVDELIHDKRR